MISGVKQLLEDLARTPARPTGHTPPRNSNCSRRSRHAMNRRSDRGTAVSDIQPPIPNPLVLSLFNPRQFAGVLCRRGEIVLTIGLELFGFEGALGVHGEHFLIAAEVARRQV